MNTSAMNYEIGRLIYLANRHFPHAEVIQSAINMIRNMGLYLDVGIIINGITDCWDICETEQEPISTDEIFAMLDDFGLKL